MEMSENKYLPVNTVRTYIGRLQSRLQVRLEGGRLPVQHRRKLYQPRLCLRSVL